MNNGKVNIPLCMHSLIPLIAKEVESLCLLKDSKVFA